LARADVTLVVFSGTIPSPHVGSGREHEDSLHDQTSEDDQVIVFRNVGVVDGTTVTDIHGGFADVESVVVVGELEVRLAADDVVVETRRVEGIDLVGARDDADEGGFVAEFTSLDFNVVTFSNVAAGEFVVVLGGDNAAEIFGAGEAWSSVGLSAAHGPAVLTGAAGELATKADVEDNGGIISGDALRNSGGGTTPADPNVLAEVELAGVEGGHGSLGHVGLVLGVPFEGGFVTETFGAHVALEDTLVGAATNVADGIDGDIGTGATTLPQADARREINLGDGDSVAEHVASDGEFTLGAAAFLAAGASSEGFGHGAIHDVNPISNLVGGNLVVVAVVLGSELGDLSNILPSRNLMHELQGRSIPLFGRLDEETVTRRSRHLVISTHCTSHTFTRRHFDVFKFFLKFLRVDT
jgi:hypothetical protein